MNTALILVPRCFMCMLRCLGMPSMSYHSMHMPIDWNGQSMCTEGISVCMSIVNINFKVQGV